MLAAAGKALTELSVLRTSLGAGSKVGLGTRDHLPASNTLLACCVVVKDTSMF